jgi:HSP20 family protein
MNSFWNQFHELEALRRDLDEMFGGAWPSARGRHSAFLPGHSARNYPLLNVQAEEDRYVVEAFAPGLELDSLEVTVDRNVLTIAGEKRDIAEVASEKFHRRERAAGRFVRTLRLEREIDEDRVEASYSDGILSIALPMAEAALPRKVSVAVK